MHPRENFSQWILHTMHSYFFINNAKHITTLFFITDIKTIYTIRVRVLGQLSPQIRLQLGERILFNILFFCKVYIVSFFSPYHNNEKGYLKCMCNASDYISRHFIWYFLWTRCTFVPLSKCHYTFFVLHKA